MDSLIYIFQPEEAAKVGTGCCGKVAADTPSLVSSSAVNEGVVGISLSSSTLTVIRVKSAMSSDRRKPTIGIVLNFRNRSHERGENHSIPVWYFRDTHDVETTQASRLKALYVLKDSSP